MVSLVIVICTNCKFMSTDGCGPGSVMICKHPQFKDADNYENAIIQWINIQLDRIACSYQCPMATTCYLVISEAQKRQYD